MYTSSDTDIKVECHQTFVGFELSSAGGSAMDAVTNSRDTYYRFHLVRRR